MELGAWVFLRWRGACFVVASQLHEQRSGNSQNVTNAMAIDRLKVCKTLVRSTGAMYSRLFLFGYF